MEGVLGGTPGGTFVCEAVQASRDQRLRPLGAVFHQEQQLRRVHAHPSDLEERGDGGLSGAQGEAWGDQGPGRVARGLGFG